MILNIPRFLIHSGEGSSGSIEIYKGACTVLGIKRRITRECSSGATGGRRRYRWGRRAQCGDRWAAALSFQHVNNTGEYVYAVLFSRGEYGRDDFAFSESRLRTFGAR